MKNQLGNRNVGIDLLRGASILYIVAFWHLLSYPRPTPQYSNFITSRVTVILLGTFVFISGYFIGLKHIAPTRKGILSFYRKRVVRIYPLYLLALVAFTVCGLLQTTASLKAALCVSMLAAPAPPTLWFVGMMMLFYLAAPVMVIACRQVSIVRFLAYCALAVVCLLVYGRLTGWLDTRIVLYFPSFALGVLIANDNGNVIPRKGYLPYAVAGLAILLSLATTDHKSYSSLWNTPMVLSCSYLLFARFRGISLSSKTACKAVTMIGYASYCMYLFHRPTYMVMKKIYFPQTFAYQIVYLAVLCLPIVIASSFITQTLYDAAQRAFDRALGNGRTVPQWEPSSSLPPSGDAAPVR